MADEIAQLRNDIKELTKTTGQVVTQVAVLTQRFDDMDKHIPPCKQLEDHVTNCHTNSLTASLKKKAATVLLNAIIVAALGLLWIGFSAKVASAITPKENVTIKEK